LSVRPVSLREEAFDEGGFLLLHFEDALLDGVLADELVHEDGLRLADAMGAVARLGFGGGIPPGIVMDHGVGGGEVDAGAPRL
jgi:hypothetical protein